MVRTGGGLAPVPVDEGCCTRPGQKESRPSTSAELKAKIQETLKTYNVPDLEALEQQIATGRVPEHPTYEEYLSALTCQGTMTEHSERLAGKVHELIAL